MEHLASILLQRTVRLVFRQCHEARVEDKGISCDTGLLLIRFRDTAVDDEQLAFSLYRAFSILDLYRYMTVQDMRSLRIQAEFCQDLLADILSVDQFIIRNGVFLMCFLVCHETPFESRHLIFTKQR